MEGIVIAAAALACPVGMGLMMWFMARGMRQPRRERETASPEEELARARRRLEPEIERLEEQRREEARGIGRGKPR